MGFSVDKRIAGEVANICSRKLLGFGTRSILSAHELRHLVQQLLQVVVADLVGERRDERLALVRGFAAEGAWEVYQYI